MEMGKNEEASRCCEKALEQDRAHEQALELKKMLEKSDASATTGTKSLEAPEEPEKPE
jgi:hypothetical protein